jgi:CHAD domain-containing protein
MYKLEPKTYFVALNDSVQKVNNRLEKYLEESSEENVHSVRIAIRKIESAWSILPKKIRQKRKIRKFIQLHKKFFKANSEIRDCDIIQKRLDLLSTTEEIKKLIDEKKKSHLRTAQRQAKQAQNVKFPKIAQIKISPAKLEKRFKKISVKLTEKIHSLIPVVISSESKIAELHQLRKDCKKLRYILELTPNAESSNFVAKLRQMQDLLGHIHDSDITMDYLKKISGKNANAKELLKKESETRTQLYKEFVEKHKEDLVIQK